MSDASRRISEAASASGEALREFVKDRSPDVLNSATLNSNLTEDMALRVARNRNCPPEALGFLASDARFRTSYKLKLAICKNPRTPVRVSLSLLKYLRIFDLGDLTRNQFVPVALRQKVEQQIMERITSMPSGIRSSLSRRANSTVVEVLMERSGKEVILSCLESPVMTEGLVFKAIGKSGAKPVLVRTVASHVKWSLRYRIRFALIRNFHTPLKYSAAFIKEMKAQDLRFLYNDARTPKSTKPFIYRELMDRGQGTDEPEDEVFDIDRYEPLPEEYRYPEFQIEEDEDTVPDVDDGQKAECRQEQKQDDFCCCDDDAGPPGPCPNGHEDD